MNLFSSGKTIFYSLAALVRKILFLPRENKIHIFAPPCNILYIIVKRLRVLLIWSAKGKCFDILSNFQGNVLRSVWRICIWILGLKG